MSLERSHGSVDDMEREILLLPGFEPTHAFKIIYEREL
jgi:hypothetical protein